MVKLVVSDLDGTLLNQDHRVSEYTQEVVKQLISLGTKFVIATGRHHRDIWPMVESVGGNIFYITSNGARIHNKQGDVFHAENLKADIAEEILSLSADFVVHRNVYTGDDWFVETENHHMLRLHHDSKFYYQVADLSEIDVKDIIKIYFIGENSELRKLEEVLAAQFGADISLTYSLEHTLEVMASGVTKATALRKVLAHKSIHESDVMGFGDGMNDVEMLQLVEHPVLMENAHPGLKSAVRNYRQARPNSEDGVAHFLKTYFW